MTTLKFEARDYGYTVISKFETIMRNRISETLQNSTAEYYDFVPEGVISIAKSRSNSIETMEDVLENIDFSHIKEIITYKNNYSYFNVEETLRKNDFIAIMDSLYSFRCRIAHIRDYFSYYDLSHLIDEIQKLKSLLNEDADKFFEFVNNLQTNPEALVTQIPVEFITDAVNEYEIMNNLPMADYMYEGGFVGRQDDIEKIIKMIQTGMHRVITITGAGGVGKSALVLKIANQILKDKIVEFDFVIWVSAKENQLTYLGIEDLEPTLRDYDELLDTILNTIGFNASEYSSTEDKEKDVNTLFDSCNRALIIIDNLETIRDDRIINFILDSHPKASFLITSRTGLGQVERRYDLKELKEREAVRLFRVICNDKKIDQLKKLSDDVIGKYVNKIYCYPLAIKWVLGQVVMGKDINKIVENIQETSSDISLFCFEQIYNDISSEGKMILCALSMYDDMVPKGILKYICNLKEDVFEDSAKELTLVSLIIPEQRLNAENSEINTLFSLLPLTRGYIKTRLDCSSQIKAQLQDKMVSVDITLEEAEKAKVQYRYSLSNLGANTEDEKVAAMLAQTGYQKYIAGNYPDAVDMYKRAIEIAPRLSSIYRNWAIMESMEQHNTDADLLMDKASKLSPNDTQIWLSWGNMKRKNDKIKDAYEYYEKAYKLSPNDNVVLNSYAQAISRMGDYKRADELFKKALEVGGDTRHNKHLIINYTSIAENLRKWAEYFIKDRDYTVAEQKILEAKENIQRVLALDKKDIQGNILRVNILYTNGVLKRKLGQDSEAADIFESIIKLPNERFKEMEISVRASLELVDICIRSNNCGDARKYLTKDLERNVKRINKETITANWKRVIECLHIESGKRTGVIIRCNTEKKYMVIEEFDENRSTYLAFRSAFKEFIVIDEDLLGRKVKFIPDVNEDKRIASNIEFLK